MIIETESRRPGEQASTASGERRRRQRFSSTLRWLPPLLAAFLLLSLAYHYSVPLFEAPDETSHIEYLAFLHHNRALPRHGTDPDVPGEGIQPPLYYVMTWPLFAAVSEEGLDLYLALHNVNWRLYGHEPSEISELANPLVRFRQPSRYSSSPRLFDRHAHLSSLLHLRWVSLVFGVLAVTATFLGVLRMTASQPMAFLTAGLLAFNPQFLFVTNCVSNDSATVAIGSAALWLVADSLREQSGNPTRRQYLLAGLLLGAGFLIKKTTIPGLAVAAFVLLSFDARPLTRRLRDVALMGLVALLLAAPYFAWNLASYGDPLGIGVERAANALLPGPERFGGRWNFFSTVYWDWTFESYWARFGWMNLQTPKAVYLAFFALSWTGVLGFFLHPRAMARGEAGSAPSGQQVHLEDPNSQPATFIGTRFRIYLVGSVLATLAAHVWFNLHVAQAQGRHLFAVAPQISCILALGLAHIGRREPSSRVRATVVVAPILALLGLAIYCLAGLILPAYAR